MKRTSTGLAVILFLFLICALLAEPAAAVHLPKAKINVTFDGPTAEYGENVVINGTSRVTDDPDVLLVCYQTPGRFNLMYSDYLTNGTVTFPLVTTYGFAWDPTIDATCTADIGHAHGGQRVVDASVSFTLGQANQ